MSWYDGTSDPLDTRGRVQFQEFLTQKENPRQLDAQKRLPTLGREIEFQEDDPLAILIACEDRDEDQGCERGTHAEEYHIGRTLSTSRK